MKLKFYPKGSSVPCILDLPEVDCIEISGIVATLHAEHGSDSVKVPCCVHVSTDAITVEGDLSLGLGPPNRKTIQRHVFDEMLAEAAEDLGIANRT